MITYLVLDCNYLCHRHFSAMGQEMSYGGEPTGMLFGFFRNLLELRERFDSTRFIFCFDYGKCLRYQVHASYKAERQARRAKYSPEEKEQHATMQRQLDMLRTEYLPSIGFANVFYQKGYEADDVIASVVLNLKPGREAIIVTSDHDSYQLLGPRVSVFHPTQKKLITDKSFTKEWGLHPSQWVDVKSMAGCKSDNIPGINGIGEKTAAQFLCGKLKATSKKFETIVKANDVWKENFELVRLPYPNCNKFPIYKDEPDVRTNWRKFAKSLGMHTLLDLV